MPSGRSGPHLPRIPTGYDLEEDVEKSLEKHRLLKGGSTPEFADGLLA